MDGLALNCPISLRTIDHCSNCGITFAVPEGWYQVKRKDHTLFWCPNGHEQYYPAQSEEERLNKQVQELTTRCESAHAAREQLQRRLRAQRGQATRLRKRIAAGVCPACHRHFAQLQSHMSTKHPAYGGKPRRLLLPAPKG